MIYPEILSNFVNAISYQLKNFFPIILRNGVNHKCIKSQEFDFLFLFFFMWLNLIYLYKWLYLKCKSFLLNILFFFKLYNASFMGLILNYWPPPPFFFFFMCERVDGMCTLYNEPVIDISYEWNTLMYFVVSFLTLSFADR